MCQSCCRRAGIFSLQSPSVSSFRINQLKNRQPCQVRHAPYAYHVEIRKKQLHVSLSHSANTQRAFFPPCGAALTDYRLGVGSQDWRRWSSSSLKQCGSARIAAGRFSSQVLLGTHRIPHFPRFASELPFSHLVIGPFQTGRSNHTIFGFWRQPSLHPMEHVDR